MSATLQEQLDKVDAMQNALERTGIPPGKLDEELYNVKQALFALDETMNGNRSKSEIGERNHPTIQNRMFNAFGGMNTYGPTATQMESLKTGKTELDELKARLETIINSQIKPLEEQLLKAGAPWIRGQPIPEER